MSCYVAPIIRLRTIRTNPAYSEYLRDWGPTSVVAQQGPVTDFLKYTSYLTDDLTVTGLIGKSYSSHVFTPAWGKATYTWSRNWGNTEGQVLSDIGQADVATTQAWDFPEFSVGADGNLPNDRTHQVKLFGYYQVDPEWGIGGNFLAASGRPRNCIGNAPSTSTTQDVYSNPPVITNYSGYGSAYFFCNGVYAPRGSYGNLPPDLRLDVNFSYKPAGFKGFNVKLDIFNLFNRQAIETIEERMYNTNATSIRTTYGSVQSYNAPRTMKLTAQYDYKF